MAQGYIQPGADVSNTGFSLSGGATTFHGALSGAGRADSDGGTLVVGLDVPSDFAAGGTLFRMELELVDNPDDGDRHAITVQVFESDGTTPLTNQFSFTQVTSAQQTRTFNFTLQNGVAAADWQDAHLKITVASEESGDNVNFYSAKIFVPYGTTDEDICRPSSAVSGGEWSVTSASNIDDPCFAWTETFPTFGSSPVNPHGADNANASASGKNRLQKWVMQNPPTFDTITQFDLFTLTDHDDSGGAHIETHLEIDEGSGSSSTSTQDIHIGEDGDLFWRKNTWTGSWDANGIRDSGQIVVALDTDDCGDDVYLNTMYLRVEGTIDEGGDFPPFIATFVLNNPSNTISPPWLGATE